MKKSNVLSNLAKGGLKVLERQAEKKANAECRGYLYEPKVPTKLKKTITMGLVCVLTVVGVLAGSANTYKAENFKYKNWSTSMYSPASSTYADTQRLYYSPDEDYRWAVTSFGTPSGYGQVTLSSRNVNFKMHLGNKILNTVASKDFNVTGWKNSAGDYATFTITMNYDTYSTWFKGYVKIK